MAISLRKTNLEKLTEQVYDVLIVGGVSTGPLPPRPWRGVASRSD